MVHLYTRTCVPKHRDDTDEAVPQRGPLRCHLTTVTALSNKGLSVGHSAHKSQVPGEELVKGDSVIRVRVSPHLGDHTWKWEVPG